MQTCSGGACGTVAAEAARLVPLAGNLLAGASAFASVRLIGLGVIEQARRSSEQIYGALADQRHPCHPLRDHADRARDPICERP